MPLLVIVLCSALILGAAYLTYGRLLARLLKLDDSLPTPAVELRDDVDYVPIEPKFLMGQHFSAIAAAGPIVGPILAGLMFGWVPALIWILLGCIFIGGVHDLTSLVASVRHKARSIAEVVRDHMTRRSYLLFLTFIWISLVYIVVAFTDLTAQSFVGQVELENGEVVRGGGIATTSLIYLALPMIMGVLLRYTRISLGVATLIFLPLVALSIYIGQLIPFELDQVLKVNTAQAHQIWDVVLLGYCFVASLIPMWLLLQPRGHLGGYLLYAALGAAALGLVFGGQTAQYPAFLGWESGAGATLFPILFITIACGACSGFHSIVASGTTSKQLCRESDAKPIGYGAMLLEGLVAVVSLCCVMMLAADSELLKNPTPNFIYARGIGQFVAVVGVPAALGISFGLMAFTTFIYDTLDVCTRLGRYIVQELTGWHDRKGRLFATALTAGAPLLFILRDSTDAAGKPAPLWKVFWSLFGASNQLLAALTLLGVTVWLWKTTRARWVWFVTGLPTVLMYVMSVWALLQMVSGAFLAGGALVIPREPAPWIGALLIGLALLMLVEAIRVLTDSERRPPAPAPVPAVQV